MANEIMKEIKTRIALKYNTYEYWATGEGKDYAPLKGEVCFCAIESKDQGAQTAPTVLFKVGIDGQTKFSALKWASALAADVYDWAKVAGANVFTKDGVGNVVSGIEYDATLNGGKGGFKFTTASVATAEGLEDLQKAVEAIEKDIEDNRDAWTKDDNDNTTYQFSIPTTGDDKGKLLVEKKEIGETTWTKVGAYDFVTPDELNTILGNYYNKSEVDGLIQGVKDIINGLDESITTVAKGTGISVSDAGTGNDHAYTIALDVDGAKTALGLDAEGIAAYVTVESLNATAKDYADDVQDNLTSYENAHKDDYTNTKIDELVQGAKDYADAKPHENTAHTHVSGSGIKVDNAGGISGEVKADLNVAFELVDKTIRLYDKDDATKTAIATLDATEFIADGMLSSVTADQANNKLVFEWNTDAGVTKTEIPLDSIADIYTGSNGTEVNIAVSNQNVISASLNSEVATKITHGETAYNWGDHSTEGYLKSGDIAGKADKKVPAAAGNLASLDANGNLADSGKKVGDFEASGASAAAVAGIFGYTGTAAKTYAVQKDSNGKAFVNVPWTDTWNALSASQDGYVSKNWYAPLSDFTSRWIKDSTYENYGYFMKDSFSVRNSDTEGTPYGAHEYATLVPGALQVSIGDDSTYRSTTYAHREIKQDINGIEYSIELPVHRGLMAVIDENGQLGGYYEHDLKNLVFGYDNYWAEIGNIDGSGYLTVSNATDSISATVWATYGPTGISVNNDNGTANSATFSFPRVNGANEFVVAGSTEIVYVLDCN